LKDYLDLRKGIHEEILPHCYQVTEQSVILMNIAVIDELRMYDLPRHRKSFANLINGLLALVDDLLNKKNSVDLIPFNRESVSEEPAIVMSNPCKVLPNCNDVGQETSRSSLVEIVDPKSPSKSIETTSSASMLGGQQNKGEAAGCTEAGLTGGQPGLTASPRLLQNKSKPKTVKPKKSEIGVWKTVESKGRHKHQREKPTSNEKLLAKSQRQNNVNGANRSKNSKHPKPSPREKFHNENRQLSNSQKSIPFPRYGLSMLMPWEPYFNMHYFCPPWYYNSYMSSPSYFCPNYISHREPVINELSPMHNDRFNHKNQPTQKNKHKVIKQVYCDKNDGRLNKNLDLTLDIEKPTVEKSSASFIDQIVPNNEHVINNIAEQRSCSAGGQHDLEVTGSQGTGLTGVPTGLTGLARKSGGAANFMPKSKLMRKKPNFAELLHKYQKIA
jgi:hypothetical protein